MKRRVSENSGDNWSFSMFKYYGKNVIIEKDVLIFHPENIILHDGVYIGHRTILKGYYKNIMEIGQGTWIGQNCFLHSAGGIKIGKNVGVGIGVTIITSAHKLLPKSKPILLNEIEFKEVIIEDDCDIGIGSKILPGVKIGRRVQVGAGAVVNKNIPPNSVVAGVPAYEIKRL